MTSPETRTHDSQRRNWFLPPNVSRSSSTPLFANIRHIPDMMPDIDAYDMARSIRVRSIESSKGCSIPDGG